MRVLRCIPTPRGHTFAPCLHLTGELRAPSWVRVLLLLNISTDLCLGPPYLLLLRPWQCSVSRRAQIRVIARVVTRHPGNRSIPVLGHGRAPENVLAAGRRVHGVSAAAHLDLLGVRRLLHVGSRGDAAVVGAQRRRRRARQVPAPELLRRRHAEAAPGAAHRAERVDAVVAVHRPAMALPHFASTNTTTQKKKSTRQWRKPNATPSKPARAREEHGELELSPHEPTWGRLDLAPPWTSSAHASSNWNGRTNSAEKNHQQNFKPLTPNACDPNTHKPPGKKNPHNADSSTTSKFQRLGTKSSREIPLTLHPSRSADSALELRATRPLWFELIRKKIHANNSTQRLAEATATGARKRARVRW